MSRRSHLRSALPEDAMSVRHSILGLMADGPVVAYQVKKSFDALTSGLWPLNDGQVYTTLQRLQRDGLVVEIDQDDQRRYGLTEAGRAELELWLDDVTPPAEGARDELTIKIALAVASPALRDRDRLRQLVESQRLAATVALQRLTRLKARLDDEDDGAAIVLDAASARLSAELVWLDRVDERLNTWKGRS